MGEARVSVCTVARGGQAQLSAMLRGLALQAHRPTELVIGCMQPEPYAKLPSMPFPVRQIEVAGDALPHSAAHNACVEAATGSTLIFLDAACIPSPDLVAGYRNAVATGGGCIIGETRQLAEGEMQDDAGFEKLWRRAGPPPGTDHRAAHGKGVHAIADHGEFTSLSFALSRKSFHRAGGFDGALTGHGVGDADFAARLARANVALFWSSRPRAVRQWSHVAPSG
ncbi:galactosyltransferase-related protein [Rhizobiaceae bacterium]|nr:galactosyltransferase-related protein [Rhizobiaceae bacterium]